MKSLRNLRLKNNNEISEKINDILFSEVLVLDDNLKNRNFVKLLSNTKKKFRRGHCEILPNVQKRIERNHARLFFGNELVSAKVFEDLLSSDALAASEKDWVQKLRSQHGLLLPRIVYFRLISRHALDLWSRLSKETFGPPSVDPCGRVLLGISRTRLFGGFFGTASRISLDQYHLLCRVDEERARRKAGQLSDRFQERKDMQKKLRAVHPHINVKKITRHGEDFWEFDLNISFSILPPPTEPINELAELGGGGAYGGEEDEEYDPESEFQA